MKITKEQIQNIVLEELEVLLKESHLVDYLNENKALRFRYNRKSNMLELWAKEKRLMMGQLMYPKMFHERGRIGFMDLYISHILNKQINLAKGST